MARWLARADLSSSIPEFIQLAETRINRDLRTSNQQTQVSGTSSGGLIAIPTDFRQAQSLVVTVDGIPRELHPVTPEKIAQASIITIPESFAVVGSNIVLNGTTDLAYTLTYFSGVPSLSDSVTQNWLILAAPDVYLYATLLQASAYLRDDERINLWGSGYENAIDDLTKQDDRLRYSPTPRMRLDFCAP